MILKNWMTTVPGLLTLVMVLFNAWQTRTINWGDLQAALIGIGLVAAKDFDVTGGRRDQ